ncbi:MAG: hypothetical protein SPG86_01490 [Gemmiger sp.]|uniref:hypothetical protein n=1 Tax=Gemmiger sp. TaxID=2049027 RepID=UPI002A911FC2|nr:hypothetical protein [Gemmiger sp.]MDY5410245.1 hypothetical protein [Gemmiger sp.]
MTELTCWPLDNKPYTSVALGAAYAARSRGVLNADSFTATTNDDNTITVGKGVGCIHVSEQWAAFPLNEGDVLLTFADADGVYPRWDVIALVYDKNANTAGLEVRTGLAAETPALPALRRNDDYDEIFLYRVTRPVGATKITADNVVDLRLDNTVCGLMRDTIDAIDTSVMQAAFEAFLTQIETELKQLHAGTATMLRATYDPQGRQTDIFKEIDKVSNKIGTVENKFNQDTLLRIMTAPNAGAHNAVYRGKYLGDTVTDEQYAAISAGTFDDLYIGDYWTIGGVNYRIAAFDYYLNSGDTACTTHHVVLVPDTCLYHVKMNSTNTTHGGYVGSEMRTANLEQAKTIIKAAFGSAHVLTKRELLTNAVNGGAPSGSAWFDSDVELMNEVQVYGSIAWGAHDGNGYNVGSGDGQFPLFMFDRTKLHNRDGYWLRDIAYDIAFTIVASNGYAEGNYATDIRGVRPAFCIC